jgi:hypothetical protein
MVLGCCPCMYLVFICSHVFVPPKQSVALMPFFGPLYLNIVKCKHIISMYSMCMNGMILETLTKKTCYISIVVHELMGTSHDS